jgi:tRNA threonylcarbamoyladenosine biosynthesis protein TsaE
MKDHWLTYSFDETIALGRQIAKLLPPKACVLLIGNLGAGKTTLAKGILNGLGLAEPDEVLSPTYTLIHEYGGEYGEARAFHIDLYRLETETQIATLGLEDLFDRQAVVLLEWAERFPSLLPAERIEIRLSALAESKRQIEILSLP